MKPPADASAQARDMGTKILQLCQEAGMEPGPMLALALLDASACVATGCSADNGPESIARFGRLAATLNGFYALQFARYMASKGPAS